VALVGQKTDDGRRSAGIVEIADRKPAPRQRTLPEIMERCQIH
jgi:hypothetical protein